MHIKALAIALTISFSGISTGAPVPLLRDAGQNPSASLPASSKSGSPYELALENLAQGKLDAAEKEFRSMLSSSPKSINALLGLAEIAFRRKQWQEGEKRLQEALRIEPGNPYVNASLGRYYATTGNAKAAEKHLLEALRQEPEHLPTRMDLADLYNNTEKRTQDAVLEYNKVLAKSPEHAGAFYARGVAHLKLGDKAKARSDFENAIRLAPENPIPHESMARLQAQQGDVEQALKTLDKFLTTYPQMSRARVLKSEILSAKGDQQGAIQELEYLAKNSPKSVEFRLRLAMAYHAQGKLEPALDSYKMAAKLDPKSALALNNAAAILLQQKKSLDQAETWAKNAVAIAPTNADYLETLGQIQLARNKPQEALASFAKARQAAPSNPETLAAIGRGLAAYGQNAQAREYLEAALKISSNFVGAEESKKVLANLKP